MKKFLVIFAAILGITLTAYAQYGRCQSTGNVEPTLSHSGSTLYVNCENYNNYMVTVIIAAVVVDTKGDSCPKKATIVIPAKSSKRAEFRTCSGVTADHDESSVTISVSKCD